jgi:YD repeat-containing protein
VIATIDAGLGDKDRTFEFFGKTTQYGYDALYRLTSVTDATPSHQVASYAYDEIGNRITQTNANQHATSYAYDQRGQRFQRTLPLGQTESYGYGAKGNVVSRTDFNATPLPAATTRATG